MRNGGGNTIGFDRIVHFAIAHLLRLYVNYFQSIMEVVSKSRHGAKVHKVYDRARTPCQRLLDSGVLTEAKQQELATTYYGLNPAWVLKQINENLECLRKLAERHAYQQRKVKTVKVSIT